MQPDQSDEHIKQLFSIIEDKFDAIIQLLTEINSKLSQGEPMSVVAPKPKRTKKLTEKQKFHQEVLNTIERDRARQKKRAEKMFAPERERIRLLKEELAKLKGQSNK